MTETLNSTTALTASTLPPDLEELLARLPARVTFARGVEELASAGWPDLKPRALGTWGLPVNRFGNHNIVETRRLFEAAVAKLKQPWQRRRAAPQTEAAA